MKQLLLILTCVLPLTVSAKFYKGTIYYKTDGKSVDVEIEMPINVLAKNIHVKINGAKRKISSDELNFLRVYLNEGKDTYVMKRGHLVNFKKNNRERKGVKVWSLLDDVRETIAASFAGRAYVVQKIKGEEKIVVVYDPSTQGYYLSKPNDDKLVFIEPSIGRKLKTMIQNTQDYLFPECENFADNIDFKKLKAPNHIENLLDEYDKCLNN